MRRAFLIFGFISLLYLTLSRPAAWVNDVAVFDDYIYLADGRNGLRVVDVSNPDTPREVSAFKTWGTVKGVEIVWREEGDEIRKYAFLVEGGRGLHILDVTHASFPREVSVLDLPGNAVDVEVQDNTAYVAAEGAGLQIIQIGDIRRPRVISTYETAGEVISVAAVDQNQVYIGDTNEKLTVLDLSNPISPTFLGTYSAQADIEDITLDNGYIYLAAGERGLVVLRWAPSDLTESGLQIVETAVVDTPGETTGLKISGVYLYLADNQGGFRLIDISNPEQPVEISSDEGVGRAVDLDVSGNYVYIADGYDGLQVVHAPVYANLQSYGDPNEQGFAEDVVVQRGLAYLADGDKGLRILNVENPVDPREIASYDFGGYAVALAVRGDFAYIADRDRGGLHILPVSDPFNLQSAPVYFDTPGQPQDLELVEDYVLVADGDRGVRIINISNPSRPFEMASIDTTGDAVGLDVVGDYLYIADGSAGLRIVDLATPITPVEVAVYDTPGDARSVMVIEVFEDSSAEGSSNEAVNLDNQVQSLAYIADGSGGITVADVSDPEAAVLLGSYQDIVFAQEVFVIGQTAYVSGREQGLLILDVSNPAEIELINAFDSPGSANSFYLEGEYAYIADGGRGLRIVDLVKFDDLREIGFYDAPATATKVTTAGGYAYLVDGMEGLWVMDVFSPQARKTIGFYATPGESRNLTVEGSIAFIADGSEGLQVVDISNPAHPIGLAAYDTSGIAVDVDVVGSYAYIADQGKGLRVVDMAAPEGMEEVGFLGDPVNPFSVVVRESYAYLTDSEAGLWIVNIADPREPTIASVFDDVADAKAVALRGDYAYMVAGEQGLAVIDVSNPTQPQGVARLGTPGNSEDLSISGEYAFIADGSRGISVIDISNPARPARINYTETNENAAGIHVVRVPSTEENPEHFTVFTAVLGEGLQVSDVVKLVEPVGVGFYETPGNISAWQVIQSINAGRFSDKAMRSLLGLLTSYLLIGVLGFIFWSGFFAQFVLPLQDIEERWMAFKRTVVYALGRHGPAIQIENGQVVQRKGEQQRRGPGVALLDTASGAMLRKKTRFTRPVGPGVVFTEAGEYVHQEAVDLRIQVEPSPPLGPLRDEDPFAPRMEDETEEAYQERQERRMMTSGLTRDGVEVVPKISAVVRLRSRKPSSETHFGYNPESVRLAVTREGVELGTLRHVRWYELPAYLAVDLWREYVRKFTLDELFAASTGRNRGLIEQLRKDENKPNLLDRGMTGWEIVKSMVEMRLTKAEVPELDGDGYPWNDKKVKSREYHILKKMGIQLISSSITSLAIPQDVEDRLVDQWLSTWLQRARKERERVEKLRSYTVREAKGDALLRHADSAAAVLYQAMKADPSQLPDLQESLLQLLRGTHQLFIRDAQLHRWLIHEEGTMLEVIEWVRRQGI